MHIKGRVRIQLLLPICTGLPDLPGLPGSWLNRRGHTGHNLQKLDRSELKEELCKKVEEKANKEVENEVDVKEAMEE